MGIVIVIAIPVALPSLPSNNKQIYSKGAMALVAIRSGIGASFSYIRMLGFKGRSPSIFPDLGPIFALACAVRWSVMERAIHPKSIPHGSLKSKVIPSNIGSCLDYGGAAVVVGNHQPLRLLKSSWG